MVETLFIVCLLIWVPILLFQVNQRSFLVLLIWLFIAPVATNVVQGQSNPFFTTPQQVDQRVAKPWDPHGTTITRIQPKDLLEPTRVLFGAFVLVFLLNAVLKKKALVPLDRTEIWMSIFSLILVGNILAQTNRTFFGLRIAADAFIVPFLGYYISRRLVTSEDRFRRLLSVLGYVGCYLVGICLIERLAHTRLFYRLQGPFDSGNALHIVMSVAFFAVLTDSVCSSGHRDTTQAVPRWIRSCVLYFTPVITLLSWSRGNWVGLLASVWMFWFLGRRFIAPSGKLKTIGAALMLIPIIIVSALALSPDVIERRVVHGQTVGYRFERWRVGMSEGLQHPIFGIGLDNSRQAFVEQIKGRSASGAHNNFLSFFSELGAVGLLAYLAVVGSIVRTGLGLYWKGVHSRDRWRGVGIISVLVAGHVPALFANVLQVTDVSHVYVYVFIGGIVGLFTKGKLVPNLDQPPRMLH